MIRPNMDLVVLNSIIEDRTFPICGVTWMVLFLTVYRPEVGYLVSFNLEEL